MRWLMPFAQKENLQSLKIEVNMSDINNIKNDAKTRMEKTLDSLKSDFGGLRAGRAHASLLDGIMVEAYGSLTPISQVGTVSVPDARTLSVSVWDKSIAKSVEKALRESDLGLNPVSDGTLIRAGAPTRITMRAICSFCGTLSTRTILRYMYAHGSPTE